MRVLNRLLAALLALAIVVIGLLLIIEVAADRLGNGPAIVHWHKSYSWADRTQWQKGSVRVTCIVLIVLGLLLLIAQLKRARVSRIAAERTESGVDTAYTRRGISAAVRSAVTDVDGVRAADVTVTHRRVKVAVTAAARDATAAQSLREPVTQAAQGRLESLRLHSAPSVRVHVDPRSK